MIFQLEREVLYTVDPNFSPILTKIDRDLEKILNDHPLFIGLIDRSRQALQLCSEGRVEWVKFRLRFRANKVGHFVQINFDWVSGRVGQKFSSSLLPLKKFYQHHH